MSLWMFSSGDGEDNPTPDDYLVGSINSKTLEFTFIPSSYEDRDDYYEEFIDRFAPYGYINFHMIDVDRPVGEADIKKALGSHLIYLSGGNTFYFLKHLRLSGFDQVLSRYRKRGGIVAGHSAGAILMTPNIETASYPNFDRDDNDVELENLKALSWVPFEFFPHYEGTPEYDEELKRHSIGKSKPIYAVPDGSAIEVGKHRIQFYGRVWAFVNGEKFRLTP